MVLLAPNKCVSVPFFIGESVYYTSISKTRNFMMFKSGKNYPKVPKYLVCIKIELNTSRLI